jgi:non-ribosomal peptide synthetase component F
MTFLGVLNVFLARLTGQEDFLVGTPVSADRDSKDLAGLIGYMLNTVVLRANLSGHPNLLQVLKRVRNTCLEAFAHKEFPFARLVERLRPGRDLSRMPVYQVEYVYVTGGSPVPHAEDVIGRQWICKLVSLRRRTSRA